MFAAGLLYAFSESDVDITLLILSLQHVLYLHSTLGLHLPPHEHAGCYMEQSLGGNLELCRD